MTSKLKFSGKAFVRGWKTGEEREVSASQARQFVNPRSKALGFRLIKKNADIGIKAVLKGGKHE